MSGFMAAIYRYDLNKYRNIKEETVIDDEKRISFRKRRAEKGVAVKIFVGALSSLLLLCCVIYGKSEINSVYSQINTAKSEYEELQTDRIHMKREIETKLSLKNIEDYAENVLGLKKLDKSQIKYVNVQSENVVDIPEEDDNVFSKAWKEIKNFVDYILG